MEGWEVKDGKITQGKTKQEKADVTILIQTK